MKWIKFIYSYLLGIYLFLHKMIRDYVLPIVHFIQFLKSLLDEDISKLSEDYKKHFADKLQMAEKFIGKLVTAFVFVVKNLLPDQVAELEHKTNLAIIKMYITYIKTLSDQQRNMLLFKTASLMLMWFMEDHDKPVTETEADFITQSVFTYLKHKGQLTST